jgi:twitching motility protein PilT
MVQADSSPLSANPQQPAQQIPNPGEEAAQTMAGQADPTVVADQQAVASELEGGFKTEGKTMADLLELTLQKDASDLHISVGYPISLRLDGTLHRLGAEVVTPERAKKLIYEILDDQKKEILEVNKEVDLSYSFQEKARFRINAYHAKGHLSAAFRLIPRKIRSIEELFLPKILHEFTKLPQGLVLVVGPTGHGKSTTLAAMLQEINTRDAKHILTIEDPIEYVYPTGRAVVDQRELHQDTHSWEIALRNILRQDPDVILVGEMRDFETIAATITAAETGHLVFATLHTNSAAQSIDRIIDVFPEHQQAQIRMQLANVIEAVVSQRLLPIIGGGRRVANEVMIGTAAVRNAIREAKTYQIDNIIQTSADVGMITLEKALVELVRQGKITLEVAQNNTTRPEEVLRLMRK